MNARPIVVATLLALPLAVSGAFAAPYAPQEFDFSGLDSADLKSSGTVESVRKVAPNGYPPELADVLEHAIHPESREELVVLLDDGRTVMVTLDAAERVAAGQRVKVLASGRGVLAK